MKAAAAGAAILVVAAWTSAQNPRRPAVSVVEVKQAFERGDRVVDVPIGATTYQMVRIEPGSFDMGSPRSEEGHDDNESPVRHVKISKAFYIGKLEVTQGQYVAVSGTNPSNYRGDDLAMDQLTYPRAIEFCQRLSQRIGVMVTLPTEAQWEFACRAGTSTRYYSGDREVDLDRVAWYEGNSGGRVHRGGLKEPNAWGLYDMLGNVWEFNLDRVSSYQSMGDTDPVGSINPNYATIRGGGYLHPPDYCRAACRLVSNARLGIAGMRLAANP
jgi:formylglycine-generating enzyme required for sulfatase activity